MAPATGVAVTGAGAAVGSDVAGGAVVGAGVGVGGPEPRPTTSA